MSTMVQLSFGIKEKLCLEDHAFSPFNAHRKPETQATSVSKSTSFASQVHSGQWPTTSPSGSTARVTSALTTSTSNKTTDIFSGASGAVAGIPFQRFEQKKPKPHIKSIAIVRTSAQARDHSQTTIFDLKQYNFQRLGEKSLLPFDTKESGKHTLNYDFQMLSVSDEFVQHKSNATDEICEEGVFPRIVDHSNSNFTKNLNYVMPSTFVGIPPNKKHCRSRPTDFVNLSKFSSPWKPGAHSRVWVPITQFPSCSIGGSSASLPSRQPRENGSRSIDVKSSSKPLFAASPVPRPASVTVIKQEGASCTLSFQHQLSGQIRNFSFSPVVSPSSAVSPASSKIVETHSRSSQSATKRSLSFSDDFDYRESIEYTPTPEFEQRFDQDSRRGLLLRCQSHPSDLNLKRGKGRRKARLCHLRPCLDFAKMKRTKYKSRNRCKERNPEPKNLFAYPSSNQLSNHLSQISPAKRFPSIISLDCPSKKNASMKLEPLPSSTSPSVSFTVGCSQPLRYMQGRISPSTDIDDDTVAEAEVTGGGETPFIRECHDLDINEIEGESDDEMKTQ